MEDQILYSFQKNVFEKVGFALKNYMGKDLLDIRIYHLSQKGDLRPTKKGVSIQIGSLESLKNGVTVLEKTLVERKKNGGGATENN